MTRDPHESAAAAAHAAAWIDEGWSALESENLERAEKACAQAEAAAPELPDTLHLRGALAESQGNTEAALATYRRAAAADQEFASPRLAAAGLLLDRDDPEGALELAREALASAQGEERVETLLVCAEIAASRGDGGSTRENLAEAATTAEEASQIFAAAHALLDAGAPDAAERAFTRARNHGAAEADVRYGLGLVASSRGDRQSMVEHFLEVARLDRETPPSYRLSEDEFEAAAERALGELPEEVIELLENVPVLLDEAPSDDLIREGIEPRLLGLFSGVPLPEKSHIEAGESPQVDAVHLFRRNLEREYRNAEELTRQIRVTVLHETAHFFGLEDDELHRMGLG